MSEPRDCATIPPLAFELVLAGERPGPHAAAWFLHIDGCPRCQGRLAEARAAGERWTVAAVRPERPGLRRRWWMVAPALGVAAALLLLLLPRRPEWQPKGAPALTLLVKRGAATTRWEGGALRAGDAVQLLWTAPRAGHLAVLARDRHGAVTIVHPEESATTAPIAAGVDQPLGRSLIITAASDGLQLWTVFLDRPAPLAPLADELRVHAALAGAPPLALRVEGR
jgi:hypothetical protein